MYVCVIGTGYVGLTTGAVFADLGNDVMCIDKNAQKIENLRQGIMPIYEPGLEEMVLRNIEEGRLTFSTDTAEGVRKSEVVFIAVGTPPKADGSTDLSQVEGAAKDIAACLDRYKIVVNKSTVPVGTGNFVRQVIEANKRRAVDFDVVSNPEFLREGSAIQDSFLPDRIVIGAPSQNVAMSLLELYAPIERPMLITDVYSAELIKYASNAFLATKISFINAIADICERVGADVSLVAKGMGADQRIGKEFLQAGLGYGGSCFPKDTLSLIHTAKALGEDFAMLEEVVKTNDRRTKRFVERIVKHFGGSLAGKRIGVLGLAFKPNTDDMRDAKSVEVIKHLHAAGAKVVAYDPIATDNAKPMLPADIGYEKSAYDAAKGADALVIMTEWNEFKLLNLEKVQDAMGSPVIFDGRNIYPLDRMERTGFEYHSIGRRSVTGRRRSIPAGVAANGGSDS
ncbi:MAG: UDP-glucose/GDP-mannose dehydrogenase family protein [Candidatus Sumerlaeia bacterium]|nr:UDP-glucose/GDP-mannose dehydrogenase family protein [Candidatus Sumerlaeia bacterium]